MGQFLSQFWGKYTNCIVISFSKPNIVHFMIISFLFINNNYKMKWIYISIILYIQKVESIFPPSQNAFVHLFSDCHATSRFDVITRLGRAIKCKGQQSKGAQRDPKHGGGGGWGRGGRGGTQFRYFREVLLWLLSIFLFLLRLRLSLSLWFRVG